MRFVEEGDEVGCHRWPDTVDIDQILIFGAGFVLCRLHRRPQRRERAVVLGQQACVRLAHLADAEGIDEPVERNFAFGFNCVEQFRDRLFAPAFALGDRVPLIAQAKDVAGLRHDLVLPEGFNVFRAQPFDVEGVAGDEMLQALDLLIGAGKIAGAAPDHFSFFAQWSASSGRTGTRPANSKGLRSGRPFLLDDADDLWDHIAGPLPRRHASPSRISLRWISSSLCKVARLTTTPPTVIGSSSATGVNAPVRPTWIVMARRTVSACSAREFVCGRPARCAAAYAKPPLPVQTVHLIDDASRYRMEAHCAWLERRHRLRESLPAELQSRDNGFVGNPQSRSCCSKFPMRFRGLAAQLPSAVNEYSERPPRRNGWVELPKAAGRGVARVCEDLLAVGFLPFVQGEEIIA